MRWVKYLITGLLIGIVVIAVVIGIVVFTFDSNEYKKVLVAWVEHATDGSLKLEGPVSIEWSKAPAVGLSKLSFISSDQNDRIEIDTLDFQIELFPLIHGMLIIPNIAIKNGQFIFVAESAESSPPADDVHPIVPILQRAQLDNLSFEYHDKQKKLAKSALLRSFAIDSQQRDAPLLIKGSGIFSGKSVSIVGEMGNLDLISDSNQLFPIDVRLLFSHSALMLQGSIAEPRKGRGLDLQVRLTVDELDQALSMLDMTIPELGALNIDGKLTGNFSNPALVNTHVVLNKDNSVRVDAEGSVADILDSFDAQFRVKGHVSNPGVIRWLLPERWNFMDRIDLDGLVRFNPNNGRVDDLTFVAKKNNSVDLNLVGNVAFDQQLQGWRFSDLNLSLDAVVNQLQTVLPESDFKLFHSDKLTLLGQLNGNQSRLRLKQAKIGLFRRDAVDLQATSEVLDLTNLSNVNIALVGNILDSNIIGQWLPARMAQAAQLEIQTNLTRKNDAWSFRGVALKLNNKAGFNGRMDGSVELVKRQSGLEISQANLNIQFIAPSLATVGQNIPQLKPQVGPLRGRAHILASMNRIDLENIDLGMGEGPLVLSAKGGINGLKNLDSNHWKFDKLDLDFAIRSEEGHLDNWLRHAANLRISPFSIHGRYSGSSTKGQFHGEYKAARSQIIADVAVIDGPRKPSLSGVIKGSELDLADLGLNWENSSTEPITKGRGQYFSRETLTIPDLSASDLDLQINVDRVWGFHSELSKFVAGIEVNKEGARIKDSRFNMAGGDWNISGSVSADPVPEVTLNVNANELDAAALIGQPTDASSVTGSAFFSADLTSRGLSSYDLVSQLDGELDLALVQGRFKDAQFDLLALKLIRRAIPLLKSSDSGKVNCAAVGFDFTKGLGQSQVFFIDTPDLIAKGEGQINLVNESVDIMIRTKPKKSIFPAGLPVRISGLLVDPNVTPVPISAAIKFAAELALDPISIPGEALEYIESLTELLGKSKSLCLPK